MGISVSRYTEISSNELVARFCSDEPICANDPFWNRMLAYNITPPGSSEEQLIFDSNTEALMQSFVQNNPQTGNLGSLVHVFITRATELLASPTTDNAMLAWQTFNALFVIRAVVKYLVEMLPEYQLNQHLDAVPGLRPKTAVEAEELAGEGRPPSPPPPSPPSSQEQEQRARTVSSESRLEMLCDALVGLICDVPLTDNTYYLHLECINTILALMSVYMFAGVHGTLPERVERERVYRTLFRGRYGLHAPLLVKTLLNNFSSAHAAPAHMFGCSDSGGSLVINLASGIWNMLTFSSAAARPTIYTHPPADSEELQQRMVKDHPVANQSCLLLLALTNHCLEDNLYRSALLCCQDTAETSSTTPSKDTNGLEITPPRIEMAALHRALCATVSLEQSTLLLYLMLHSCRGYKRYVMANLSTVDALMVPILQCLYNAPDSASHHIYMSLIVLLILTEEDTLTKTIHQIIVKNPLWYTERALPSVSLGGLAVLVLVRTAQHNIVKLRDKYLHTNCLAAIANMSGEFRNLHPYVAQRLVSLYETLTKRRARLCTEIEDGVGDVNGLDLVHHRTGTKAEALWEHICVLDEVLRMLLEILNSCLCNQLQNNLNLVYALLHKKGIFTASTQNQPILNNIEMVIGYFSSRLQRVQEGAGGDLGVTEVLACIKKGAEQWSNDRLKKFPELKFRYVEEERPEEFFTPYVWGLISSCGSIYWDSEGGMRAVNNHMIL